MSDVPFDGWWRASDGRWYPPETHPAFNAPGAQTAPPGWWKGGDDKWYPPHLHPNHTDESGVEERKLHRRALAVTWIAVLVFAGAVGAFLIRDSQSPDPVEVDGETIEQTVPPETLLQGGTAIDTPASTEVGVTTTVAPVAPATTATVAPAAGANSASGSVP